MSLASRPFAFRLLSVSFPFLISEATGLSFVCGSGLSFNSIDESFKSRTSARTSVVRVTPTRLQSGGALELWARFIIVNFQDVEMVLLKNGGIRWNSTPYILLCAVGAEGAKMASKVVLRS